MMIDLKQTAHFTLAAITGLLLALEGRAADQALTADQSLQKLEEGNPRYVASKATHPNQTAERQAEIA